MFKYIFILFNIFSYIHPFYLPFKKNKKYPDDTCSYIAENNIIYVKDCDEGKYCNYRVDESFSICESIPTEIKLILENGEEKCDSDFQCETGLECINQKCVNDCSSGFTSVRTKSGYTCVDRDQVNLYYKKDFSWHQSNSHNHGGYIDNNAVFYDNSPEIFKVRGKITMHETKDNDGKIFEPEKIEYTDIGTVEDGNFVYDEKACASGFALYFYGDGSLTKPYKYNQYNIMYKKCVTLEEIEQMDNGECKIKYKEGEGGNAFNYNVDMLNGKETCKGRLDSSDSYYSPALNSICHSRILDSDISSLCETDKIKLKMFKNYIAALTNDKKKCPESELFNDIETCRDNTLRKWSYFYENPDYYILYYDEENEDKGNTVVNYLLQKTFPSYQFSEFLNIKYIIGLLFLLYLL